MENLGKAKVRQGMKKLKLKFVNNVVFGKWWRSLEIEAGIGKVEDRKCNDGIKTHILKKVWQGGYWCSVAQKQKKRNAPLKQNAQLQTFIYLIEKTWS